MDQQDNPESTDAGAANPPQPAPQPAPPPSAAASQPPAPAHQPSSAAPPPRQTYAPPPGPVPPSSPPGYPPLAPFQPIAPPTGPPSPFRRGFALGAGAGLGFGGAMLVLGIISSLLSGLILAAFAGAASSLAGSGQTAAQPLRTVWGPANATGTLRAIPISGSILTTGSAGLTLTASTFGYEIADVLDDLTAEDADGVVLLMDTPGGTVTGSKAIADAVDRYRERTGKKVFAFVEGLSASGGMYAMAGADEVVADHGSIIGSVGVISGVVERYRGVTQTGSALTGSVTAEEITAEYITAGRGKDAGNPFRDLTPEERAMLQTMADSIYEDFVDHVASKRGIDRNVIVNELGAAIFAPERAVEVGYVDAELGRDEALRRFAGAAGLDPARTKLVQAGAPGLWAQLLGAESRAWGTGSAAEPIGGQPARATAAMCTDAATPLVYHGSLAAACG